MSQEFADASPTKRFFIDMLIRDISMEDSILDLIDNSIDGYSRNFAVSLSSGLLNKNVQNRKRRIKVEINKNNLLIEDNCGGIDYEDAKKYVFKFGRDESHSHAGLSVYGIGLKRAIFKLGRVAEIESKTSKDGFKLNFNVDDWLKNDKWQIPIEKIAAPKNENEFGTKIKITNLRPEIIIKINDKTTEAEIFKAISDAYPLFLNNHLSISVNGQPASGKHILFSESENLKAARESWYDDDIYVELFCGLRPKDELNNWKSENAGWSIVCNGRVVVHANKDKLTGFGIKGDLPEFQPKHRGFTGVVFFSSDKHPEKLPWNTTKKGLNNESLVYLRTRQKMVTQGREVIRLLDSMYKNNDSESPSEAYKGFLDNTINVDVSVEAQQMRASGTTNKTDFNYKKPELSPEEQTTHVQFFAKNPDLNRVRDRLKKRSMSAKAIGEHTFNYFLKRECE